MTNRATKLLAEARRFIESGEEANWAAAERMWQANKEEGMSADAMAARLPLGATAIKTRIKMWESHGRHPGAELPDWSEAYAQAKGGSTIPSLHDSTAIFTAGQFNRGYDLLKDTLHSRGTPINVSRTHPFRYSIPLPINSEESSYYELRRLAIIANTSLQRLQKHAVAAESHHPQKAEAFHALAAMANRARKTIAKTLGNLEDSE